MDRGARHCHELGMRAVAVLAEDVDAALVRKTGVDHDALVGAGDHTRAVGAEDARLRHGGRPLRSQRSRWLSEAARNSTSTSPSPGTGSGTSS